MLVAALLEVIVGAPRIAQALLPGEPEDASGQVGAALVFPWLSLGLQLRLAWPVTDGDDGRHLRARQLVWSLFCFFFLFFSRRGCELGSQGNEEPRAYPLSNGVIRGDNIGT